MNPKKVLETEDAMCIARAKALMRCGMCKWRATYRWQCEAAEGTVEVCYHSAHYMEPRNPDEGCVQDWEPKEVRYGRAAEAKKATIRTQAKEDAE